MHQMVVIRGQANQARDYGVPYPVPQVLWDKLHRKLMLRNSMDKVLKKMLYWVVSVLIQSQQILSYMIFVVWFTYFSFWDPWKILKRLPLSEVEVDGSVMKSVCLDLFVKIKYFQSCWLQFASVYAGQVQSTRMIFISVCESLKIIKELNGPELCRGRDKISHAVRVFYCCRYIVAKLFLYSNLLKNALFNTQRLSSGSLLFCKVINVQNSPTWKIQPTIRRTQLDFTHWPHICSPFPFFYFESSMQCSFSQATSQVKNL